jgi:hypothetical protein
MLSLGCKESYLAFFCHFLSSPEIPVFSVAVCFSLKGAEMVSTALGVQAGIPGPEVRPHLPEVKKEPENDIAHQVENRTNSSICSEKGLDRLSVRNLFGKATKGGQKAKDTLGTRDTSSIRGLGKRNRKEPEQVPYACPRSLPHRELQGLVQ